MVTAIETRDGLVEFLDRLGNASKISSELRDASRLLSEMPEGERISEEHRKKFLQARHVLFAIERIHYKNDERVPDHWRELRSAYYDYFTQSDGNVKEFDVNSRRQLRRYFSGRIALERKDLERGSELLKYMSNPPPKPEYMAA